jgi:glycosyltransferase involved in cell wall biosynthesis
VTGIHDDEEIDTAAVVAFFAENDDRATALPPTSIVIAAYNEQGVIGQVIDPLPQTICGLRTAVIVVSDGSSDDTAAEARAHGALVCEVPVSRGQGAAQRLGYRLAREGGAVYIVTIDADDQYDPGEIERVLAPVVSGLADLVTGSRKLGSQETQDLVRRLYDWAFALIVSALIMQQRITDSSFGLRAMRAEVTGAVRLDQFRYPAAELLIAAHWHGYRIMEVPATIRKRRIGQSKRRPALRLSCPAFSRQGIYS